MSFNIDDYIDDLVEESSIKNKDSDHDVEYLSKQAPNCVQWVTGMEYWGATQTFEFSRQYQILRDMFNLRCTVCNSMDPQSVDCWKKPRSYLESEVLFEWSDDVSDFVCPKCRATMKQHIKDGRIVPYNELICIAGMRSGKSYLGAHIAGYLEHVLRVMSMGGKGEIQKMFGMQKAEWLDLTFAASTATQAQQTIYAKYREMRNNSPWINKHVSFVQSMEARQAGRVKEKWSYSVKTEAIEDGWLQVRFNRSASDASGVAGRTRVLGAIDEWARLIDTDGTRSAKELYAVMNQSLKTVRAAVDNNGLFPFFGLMINVTSAWSVDDPAMELYNKASNGDIKRTFYWKGATWEFNPKITKENLEDDFIKDKAAAERDFASNPPLASFPFIDNPQLFWKCIDFDRHPKVTFKERTVHDRVSKFYNAMRVDKCAVDYTGTEYFIFMDAGKIWDCFGFAIGHGEWKSIDELDAYEGEITPHQYKPSGEEVDIEALEEAGFNHISQSEDFIHISEVDGFVRPQELGFDRGFVSNDEVFCTVVDGLFRIIPSQTNEIWFESILDVVNDIYMKLKIKGIASDHWQSVSLIQQLRSKFGIYATTHKLIPHDFMSFLQLCYSGRVSLFKPDDFIDLDQESGQLITKIEQEDMKGSTVGIVELLKLNRSPDMRYFENENKGRVRGRDSDDIARCIIGLNYMVQQSVVQKTSSKDLGRFKVNRELDKFDGRVFNPRRGY